MSLFPFGRVRYPQDDNSPNLESLSFNETLGREVYTSIDCVDGRNPIRTDWRSHNPRLELRRCRCRRLAALAVAVYFDGRCGDVRRFCSLTGSWQQSLFFSSAFFF